MCDLTSFHDSYICYGEKNTQMIQDLDNVFLNMAKSIGAIEYHIPALIDQEVLERCGYFQSFPHHLTVASYIDPKKYNDAIYASGVNKNSLVISNQYLTPAACLHIYPMLEREDIDEKVVTTKARVYRYENARFNGITRIWDFTVREIVFIGEKSLVVNMLDSMKMKALEYARSIGLPCRITLANDNFYPTKQNNMKQKFQKANSLKFELTTLMGGGDVALSSFNYHDTHFSKAFGFDKDKKIVTGCVGYGLERWVAALNEYNIEL